jgi:hypothetical protein
MPYSLCMHSHTMKLLYLYSLLRALENQPHTELEFCKRRDLQAGLCVQTFNGSFRFGLQHIKARS